MGRTKILFLAANPIETEQLNLDREFVKISERLSLAPNREHFELVPAFRARRSDFINLLLQHKPAVVHFAGHGTPDGEFSFETPAGEAAPASIATIGDIFRVLADQRTGHRIRGVVLNACYSAALAEEISQHVSCTVGMGSTVDDDDAIDFAAQFYSALFYGLPVADAFALARCQLRLPGIPEADVPQLHGRDATIRLVEVETQAAPPPSPPSPRRHSAHSPPADAFGFFMGAVNEVTRRTAETVGGTINEATKQAAQAAGHIGEGAKWAGEAVGWTIARTAEALAPAHKVVDDTVRGAVHVVQQAGHEAIFGRPTPRVDPEVPSPELTFEVVAAHLTGVREELSAGARSATWRRENGKTPWFLVTVPLLESKRQAWADLAILQELSDEQRTEKTRLFKDIEALEATRLRLERCVTIVLDDDARAAVGWERSEASTSGDAVAELVHGEGLANEIPFILRNSAHGIHAVVNLSREDCARLRLPVPVDVARLPPDVQEKCLGRVLRSLVVDRDLDPRVVPDLFDRKNWSLGGDFAPSHEEPRGQGVNRAIGSTGSDGPIIASTPVSPPKADVRFITEKDLQDGDILLSLGASKVSKAIQTLDGGKYSHAALWTGKIVESTPVEPDRRRRSVRYVFVHSLSESLAMSNRLYIDVYRHRNLSDRGAHVVSEALGYKGRPYPAQDLFMLSALLLALPYAGKERAEKMLRERCLEEAEDLRPEDEELVVCTGLVVRSYERAGLPLNIRSIARERPGVSGMKIVLEAAYELLQLRRRPKRAVRAPEGTPRESPLFAAGKEWRANWVTPRQLETCQDLYLVGRLHGSAPR